MRCPYCGSNKIELITKSDGYSMGKGLVGAAILGPVGAVAGIDGKKKQVFRCPQCSNETHDIMSSSLDRDITDAVFRFKVYGEGAEKLRNYKAQYQNIEWIDNGGINVPRTEKTESNNESRPEDSKPLGSGNVVFDIKEFLSAWGSPASYEDIATKMKSLGYLENAISDSVVSMVVNGTIKRSEDLFVLVKDLDEITQLRKEGHKRGEETQEYLSALKTDLIEKVKDKRYSDYAGEYLASKEKTLKTDKAILARLLESQKKADEIKPELDSLINNREVDIRSQKKKLQERIRKYEEELQKQETMIASMQSNLEEKKQRLAECTLFQGKIKKQLASEIEVLIKSITDEEGRTDSLHEKIDRIKKEQNHIEKNVNNRIKNKKKHFSDYDKKEDITRIQKSIDKTEREIERIKVGDYDYDEYDSWLRANHPTDEEREQKESEIKERRRVVLEALSHQSEPVQAKSLLKELDSLQSGNNITEKSLTALLFILRREGLVEKTEVENTAYYKLI